MDVLNLLANFRAKLVQVGSMQWLWRFFLFYYRSRLCFPATVHFQVEKTTSMEEKGGGKGLMRFATILKAFRILTVLYTKLARLSHYKRLDGQPSLRLAASNNRYLN